MENSEVEKKKRSIERNNTIAKIALWVGVPCVLILPVVLTHYLPGDFKDTGVIGDTIGGTTAPIVGLIGAVLVYLSFKQQLTANEIQLDLIRKDQEREEEIKQRELAAVEKEMLIIHYNEIQKNITTLTYNVVYSHAMSYNGRSAISQFCSDFSMSPKNAIGNDFYTVFVFLMQDVFDYLYNLHNNEALKPNEKKFFKRRMHQLYHQNVGMFLYKIKAIEDKDKHLEDMIRISVLSQGIDEFLKIKYGE